MVDASKLSPMALEGVKVLELGALIAGPYAGALLAQFGAEVIKIESPDGGDPLRKWRELHNGTSLWWYSQSRNKKSVCLNLKSPECQAIVRKLVKEADIVIENFRPGTLEKWGLSWDDLSAINPGLIMLRISGYGQSGPQKMRPGFAAIAECFGGLRHVTGYPDRAPVRTGVSLGDTLASLYGVFGVLLALYHRDVNKGKGQYIDVALYEAVFAIMESLIPEYSVKGTVRGRTGSSLPGIVPSNTYRCRDDHYVAVAANADGLFKRLMTVINRPDLRDNPSLAHNDGRAKQVDEIDGAIATWCARHTSTEVVEQLDAVGVPCGRIYTAADIAADLHFQAREMLLPFTLPDGQAVTMPGIVPKLSETPGQTRWLGPDLGAHTQEVLKSIGVSPEQYAQLQAAGLC
ncbi:MAG TPA: CoA transferase [Burkholderiaceae bacterium]|nr:CoA transferase [Burkholderiaceae bacterium]